MSKTTRESYKKSKPTAKFLIYAEEFRSLPFRLEANVDLSHLRWISHRIQGVSTPGDVNTRDLANKIKHVCLEDLNVKGMMQNRKLANSIARQGFYEFRQRLTTKIVDNAGTAVLAMQWFPSSKTCHNCGYIHQELTLSNRTFNCPHCGTIIDRDLNAAIVLSQYGFVNQKTRVGCTRSYACELTEADLSG